MILDHLAHADRYRALGDRIAAALDFLRRPDTAALEPKAHGTEHSLRVAIEGDDVFALVQRYATKSFIETFWEAHRTYIDVQCVLEGFEMMACAPLEGMKVIQPYDEAKDYCKLAERDATGPMSFVRVTAGMFAVFMPHDAHMPGLTMFGDPREVKKIVVKVRV